MLSCWRSADSIFKKSYDISEPTPTNSRGQQWGQQRRAPPDPLHASLPNPPARSCAAARDDPVPVHASTNAGSTIPAPLARHHRRAHTSRCSPLLPTSVNSSVCPQ